MAWAPARAWHDNMPDFRRLMMPPRIRHHREHIEPVRRITARETVIQGPMIDVEPVFRRIFARRGPVMTSHLED